MAAGALITDAQEEVVSVRAGAIKGVQIRGERIEGRIGASAEKPPPAPWEKPVEPEGPMPGILEAGVQGAKRALTEAGQIYEALGLR